MGVAWQLDAIRLQRARGAGSAAAAQHYRRRYYAGSEVRILKTGSGPGTEFRPSTPIFLALVQRVMIRPGFKRNDSMRRISWSQVAIGLAFSMGCSVVFAQATGEAVYKAKCQSCHGATGMADTTVGKALKVKPVSEVFQ